MGTTAQGLPYPEPTDPVAAGADAIRALAEAIDPKLIARIWRRAHTSNIGGITTGTLIPTLDITVPTIAGRLYRVSLSVNGQAGSAELIGLTYWRASTPQVSFQFFEPGHGVPIAIIGETSFIGDGTSQLRTVTASRGSGSTAFTLFATALAPFTHTITECPNPL